MASAMSGLRKDEVIPDVAERAAVESMAMRRRQTSMFDIGLEPGTTLSLDKDSKVTCTVTGPWEVEFAGERLSLSAAALKAINGLGYEWPAERRGDSRRGRARRCRKHGNAQAPDFDVRHRTGARDDSVLGQGLEGDLHCYGTVGS